MPGMSIAGCRPEQVARIVGEKSTVKIWSLVGHGKDAVNRIFKAVDLQATTLNMLWDVVCSLQRSSAAGQKIWSILVHPSCSGRDCCL